MRYDPFQKKAISYINEGHSVILAAPTGAGKTAIAEHVIRTCLERKEKVIYTAPIKALSNQKYRDFSKDYPDQVGILTGDVTINPKAPTLIMTTEIFRNKIVEEESSLSDYTWIIFDEMHYLDDLERGSVWEESLMFLPDHMNVLGLSATIPNIKELSDWLQTIHHRPVKMVIENNRPVPLHFFFQCKNRIYDDLNRIKKHLQAKLTKFRFRDRRFSTHVDVKPNKTTDLIEHLQEHDLLPCIYFAFSRRKTENLAKDIQGYNFLTSEERKEILHIYRGLCKKYDIMQEPSTYELQPLIERGIGYHHAGMLPTLKEVIEQLFTTKLIKVIFTTETFALGINMPARTVVFDELRKIYSDRFRYLKTRDFYQMAGRAGRRGIDKKGSVFLRVNPYDITLADLQRMIYSDPEKVTSRFNASYATILNLYAQYGEKLYDIYPLSFHYFQEKKHARKKAVSLLHSKVKILKQLGQIRKNNITEKGIFASRVYGYELLLSELYNTNVLEHLSETELAVITLALVFEPRKSTTKPKLSPSARKLEKLTSDVIFPILKIEHSLHITPSSKECSFHLSPCMEEWMRGKPFDEILRLTKADEGEIVRYFRMSIQILREILDAPISGSLKQRIHKAIDRINRDVVDAEKQLRV